MGISYITEKSIKDIEEFMNTETALSNDTIDKLRQILSSLNPKLYNVDMFTLCIKNALDEKKIALN